MNELFNTDGHLTGYAFDALLHDLPLEELERLEIAEHLSFCDLCVERYASMLVGEDLLTPEVPVASTVLQRIRQRARKLFVNKYTTVTAAASLAIVFWSAGLFNIDVTNDNGGKMLQTFTNSAASINEKATQISENFTETLNKILNRFQNERGSDNEKK